MKKHIIVTGGHHNSALVVASNLIKQGHRVTWIGHKQAASGDIHDSAEYIEVTASGIPFYDLQAGKLNSLTNIFKIPFGVWRAYRLLYNLKPDAVLSFGSYLGLTVALSARLSKIPIFIHEQTVVAGKANRIVAKFARRTYLTWESSKQFFPSRNSKIIGLPLRDSILRPTKTKLFSNSLPTILVLGGKQGSHAINNQILLHLPKLLVEYNIIHQTGTSSVTGDYERATSIRDSLPAKLTKRYQVEGYIGQSEIGSYLANCDLYLGRSGAHITYELAILGTRSILVPFLLTHMKEQEKNANYLIKQGLAVMLPQKQLKYSTLQQSIKTVLTLKSQPLKLPHDATRQLVKDMLNALTL